MTGSRVVVNQEKKAIQRSVLNLTLRIEKSLRKPLLRFVILILNLKVPRYLEVRKPKNILRKNLNLNCLKRA